MLSDAYIDVTCDRCHHVAQVPLTAIACDGWDERYVDDCLRAWGWTIVDDDTHWCDECSLLDADE